MKMPTGWWLACPYFQRDGHILQQLGMGPGALPPKGERTYHGAFLDEWWARYRNPSELLDRVCYRLHAGSHVALWWKKGEGPAPADVVVSFSTQGFDCIEDDEPEPGYLFQVYEHTGARGLYRPWQRTARSCLIIRFGAYGDHLMASSVLPHLKAEGYSITYMGSPTIEVLAHDPNISAFIRHNHALVKEDAGLIAYLDAWSKRFDRVVMLNASIERALLYRPEQTEYYRDDATRRRLCAGNYLEFVHHVAGVPYEPCQQFHPSQGEAEQAAKFSTDAYPLVMLCIAGSAPYKTWPNAPEFVVKALTETNVNLAIVGGEKDIELFEEIRAAVERDAPGQAGRLIDCTRWGIRTTMATAREARVVIGPETGVMNAIAFEPMPKIVMLSHSTKENLTRDWINTVSLSAAVPCYPCHRLHPDNSRCPRGPKSGHALCAETITADVVLAETKKALAWEKPIEALTISAEQAA